jgi:hypothetical protein
MSLVQVCREKYLLAPWKLKWSTAYSDTKQMFKHTRKFVHNLLIYKTLQQHSPDSNVFHMIIMNSILGMSNEPNNFLKSSFCDDPIIIYIYNYTPIIVKALFWGENSRSSLSLSLFSNCKHKNYYSKKWTSTHQCTIHWMDDAHYDSVLDESQLS